MKTLKLKRLGFFLAILGILAGNLIGISALATNGAGTDKIPDGMLQGYLPAVESVKTDEHLEYWGGWVGVPFMHLVTDYSQSLCCKKTYREMDGCKGLKVCLN